MIALAIFSKPIDDLIAEVHKLHNVCYNVYHWGSLYASHRG